MIVNQLTIDKSMQENFDVLVFDNYNLTYDWKSISHYSNKVFRKNNTVGYTLMSKVSYFNETI